MKEQSYKTVYLSHSADTQTAGLWHQKEMWGAFVLQLQKRGDFAELAESEEGFRC